MNSVLIIGNGGREAALALALLRDPSVKVHLSVPNYSVYDPYYPSNPSRIVLANLNAGDFYGLADYIKQHNINYVLPGPETSICAGIVDFCHSQLSNVKCIGPDKYAAQLEGSKIFGKEFLQRNGVPTGRAIVVTDIEKTICLIDIDRYRVVKADGLAAGKGVVLCDSFDEAHDLAYDFINNKRFGTSSDKVLIEEFFNGPEISYTVWINGDTAILFPPSSDYKRLLDKDLGPNTGGMGNVCRTPYASPELDSEFIERVLKPILRGLKAEGLHYNGPMFIGTIVDESGLQVLEINVRFGDPETQVIMPAIGSELFSLMQATLNGTRFIPENAREICNNIFELHSERQSVCVVAASRNYPEKSSEPAEITGLNDYKQFAASNPNNLELYFAGVSLGENSDTDIRLHSNIVSRETFVATGGRVLSIVGSAYNLETARTFAYDALKLINFDGMQYRSDIAEFDIVD